MKNITAPRNLKIKGQDHMLAYITAKEAEALKARGGSGRMTKYGVRSYDEGPGGDPSDNAGSMSDPGTQDAAGGNAGQGAGPTGAGSGSTGETGPGPTNEDTGGNEASVAAPAPNTGQFGQAPNSLGLGVMGGLFGAATGIPGLGLAGTALGTAVDVNNLNAQLGMMGLNPSVSYGPSLASNVSFGALGQSPTSQFGQALGFDALAEAPMSAFSGPPPGQGPTADTGGGSDGGLLSQVDLPSAVGPLQQVRRYQIVNNTIVPVPFGLLG